MLCPVCRHDNFEGEDNCENCGADLRTSDIPQPATSFQGSLLGGHLSDLGIGEPHLVDAMTPVAEAIRTMHEHELDCLLVMADGRLVGIFTDRDAVLKAAGRDLGSYDVRDLMTRDPVVLRAGDTIAVAIHKMAVGGFRHVPIVDGDRPLGVVSARDVFRHVAAGVA
ncbi:MAG TPA: CBS domain-containing protein [Candidatus Limnocylindrales bacterium]|jgi:predicted transcriptional regulator